MPVSYTIDRDARVVRVACSGVLTTEEMLGCIEQVYSNPARGPGMRALIDWEGVGTMLVTPQGMQAAATLKSVLIDDGQSPWVTVFIAPRDDAYWVARTYEVLRTGSPEAVRVFRQRSEAEKWLAGEHEAH